MSMDMTMDEFLEIVYPYFDAVGEFLAPFTDTLAHRFWFAVVLLGIVTVIRIIIFYTEPELTLEFEMYDSRKRLPWKILAVGAGVVLNAGLYPSEEAIYSLSVLLRGRGEELWYYFVIMMLGVLVVVSLLFSVRYLWASRNLIVFTRVWFSHLFCIGVGMVLTTALEFVGCTVAEWYKQGIGIGYLLIYLNLFVQLIAVAGAAIYATGWFFLSFFTEESLREQNKRREIREREAMLKQSEPRESPVHSTMMMPDTIRDAYGNVYHSSGMGVNSRDYFCRENGTMVTISDSDIECDIFGMHSARVDDEYMQW